MASYKTTVQPAEEPITVAEFKLHARIDSDAEDSILPMYIAAAREQCEVRVQRSLVTQTITRTSDDWPADDDVELLRGPVQSIASVQYLDDDGATQTISTSAYTLDNSDDAGPAWVLLQDGYEWPTVGDYGNAVAITFVAGYGDAADVPASLRAWISVAAAWMYEHRSFELPTDFAGGLLDAHRMRIGA